MQLGTSVAIMPDVFGDSLQEIAEPSHDLADAAQTRRTTAVATQWSGTPEACDICQRPITTVFIDGATKMGPWGILCPPCHQQHGVGLGLGKGQKYEKNKDGVFVKTGG